ncbi:MAG: FkbM family methyltransferase [Deltaproteobacteria bacterium]|nr:FkbM family methyltransferase [Deltaproteobacteria bacterium]
MDQNNRTYDTGTMKRHDLWLAKYARNNTSQFGEDGIIEKVLEVVGVNDKWCVEFGSWDGKICSNTFHLISEKGYSAVLIEGNPKRYKDLLKTFTGNDKVVPINTFVGFERETGLDSILKDTAIPKDFDLLSIDIDGNDYHVWETVQNYKPKVVLIEFNPTIPKTVEFVQPPDPRLSQGSSLLSITQLGKSKGYELVCTTHANAVFVHAKFFDLFGIKDNSAEKMMTDDSMVTHIFCGFDGTVFIRGCGIIPWQGIAYEESKVQQLPKWARKVVGDRNILRRKIGKLYRRFYKKKYR